MTDPHPTQAVEEPAEAAASAADQPTVPASERSVDELLADLAALPDETAEPALQQLGRLPLEKGKFPVMGYLATTYDIIGGVLPDDE